MVSNDNASCDGGEIPAIDPSLDSHFRNLTARGNKAFQAAKQPAADRLYRAALSEAESLLDRAADGGHSAILIAPMALTIAAHNLAVLMDRAGDADAARAVSERAAERLIETADSAGMPLALRLNCVRHLRHALHFLSDLDRERGARAADPLADRVAEVGAEVVRIATLWRQEQPAPGHNTPQAACMS